MNKTLIERLDALFAPFNRSDEPGCTVAIAKNSQPIYRRAFGMADLERGIANQPSTLMPVGSIAKQFTCAALLSLRAEGALSLNDTLAQWLPELPEVHRNVTLAQLMMHQSGVRCYLDHWMFNGYRTFPRGVPLEIQARQQSLNFEPGSRTSYCNGGYLLLSKVIERASGLAFADFVARRIFRPCGMYASHFAAAYDFGSLAASPYVEGADAHSWDRALRITEEAFGDGGLVSNVDDLLRWARYLRLSRADFNLDALSAPDEKAGLGPSDYRFGLIFQKWRGIRVVHHAGGMPGANSILMTLPDHDIDVVIAFNRTASAMGMAFQALEMLLEDELDKPKDFPATSEFGDLLGSYWASETDFLFSLTDLDGRLGLSFFGDKPFALDCWEGDPDALPFWADAGAAQIRFRRGEAPGTLEYFDGTAWTRTERIQSDEEAMDAIVLPAIGHFHSEEAATTLSFVIEQGQLYIQFVGSTGVIRFRAETIAKNLLRFWPPLFPAGKLARLDQKNGKVRSVIVSTPRSSGIIFTNIAV